jgi:RHS repeat-associated protein
VETGGGGYRVSDNYKTDAYGVELVTGGVTSNAYRFAGEQYDSDLGMSFLRARYVSSMFGRFITRDNTEPRSDGVPEGAYGYASNDPALKTDPTGNSTLNLTESGLVVGILGSLAASSILGSRVQ